MLTAALIILAFNCGAPTWVGVTVSILMGIRFMLYGTLSLIKITAE